MPWERAMGRKTQSLREEGRLGQEGEQEGLRDTEQVDGGCHPRPDGRAQRKERWGEKVGEETPCLP